MKGFYRQHLGKKRKLAAKERKGFFQAKSRFFDRRKEGFLSGGCLTSVCQEIPDGLV